MKIASDLNLGQPHLTPSHLAAVCIHVKNNFTICEGGIYTHVVRKQLTSC